MSTAAFLVTTPDNPNTLGHLINLMMGFLASKLVSSNYRKSDT